MRILFFSLLFLTGLALPLTATDVVTLTCEMDNCGPELKLFRFNGIGFSQVAEAKLNGEGVYEFEIPVSGPSFYYVGARQDQVRPLLLGPDPQVVLRGNCADIRLAEVQGSPFNDQYEWLKGQVNELKQETGKLVQRYRFAQSNPQNLDEVVALMATLDERKMALLDSMRTVHEYFAGVVALNTYLSYQNNQGDHTDEIDYFAREYFRWADLSQEVYAGMPWVYEAFKSYALTLSSVGLGADRQRQYLDDAVDRTPTGSITRQLALGGVMISLKQKQQAAFSHFAERFIREFGESDPAAAASLQQELEQARSFTIGGTPPDFSMETPEGELLSLSDLRGQVLLVDFWASWCGPCRKENPNVVRLYQQYKDKGFEILGVSLDSKRDRWLQAIEQDGLTWPHVSDLQGWKNAAAQLYGVSSIPHTVLLDAEGRIIARNLRGRALEQKLAEIFE